MTIKIDHYLLDKPFIELENSINMPLYLKNKMSQFYYLNFIFINKNGHIISDNNLSYKFDSKTNTLDILDNKPVYLITELEYLNLKSFSPILFIDYFISYKNNTIKIQQKRDSTIYLNPHSFNNKNGILNIDILNYSNLKLFYIENTELNLNHNIFTNILLFKNSTLEFENIFNILENQYRYDSIVLNHIESQTKSSINYFSINKGSLISQINSTINQNAEECETHQKITHLVASPKAQTKSVPNLIIKNKNVIASHGNTIFQINKNDLNYLQQRGISSDKAKEIIYKSKLKELCTTQILNDFFKDIL